MNHDEPKLTAYALDETTPAEIAAFLKQPGAETEVAETREVAGILRGAFRAELGETLLPHQRAAVLRAADIAGKDRAPLAPQNIEHPALWRTAGFWQAAAACFVVGVGVFAITASMMKQPGGGTVAKRDGVDVNISGLASGNDTQPDGPGIFSPGETQRTPKAVVNVDSAKNSPPGAVKPDVTNLIKPLDVKLPQAVANNTGPQQPSVVSSNPDAAQMAKADIGKKKPGVVYGNSKELPTETGQTVTLSPEEAGRYFTTSEYLEARWQEASSLREGSTYADLTKHFRRDGVKGAWRFVMIRCPFIKVEVEFAGDTAEPPSADAVIRKISRPYFEPEQRQ